MHKKDNEVISVFAPCIKAISKMLIMSTPGNAFTIILCPAFTQKDFKSAKDSQVISVFL
jgi:hypothetical protein